MNQNSEGCSSGPSSYHSTKRVRVVINACWNCKNLNISDGIEHEDGGGVPYCLMDGCNVQPFNKCQDWEDDAEFEQENRDQ